MTNALVNGTHRGATRRRPARHERGYALMLTVVLAVILTVVGATIVLESGDNLLMTKAVGGHAIAVSRAEQGAQQTMAQLRVFGMTWSASLQPCAVIANCTTLNTNYIDLPSPNNTNTIKDLMAGGGMQWDAKVYKLANVGGNISYTSPVFLIVADGYYGFSGSPNMITATVEAEVTLPGNGLGTCSGYPPDVCGGGSGIVQ